MKFHSIEEVKEEKSSVWSKEFPSLKYGSRFWVRNAPDAEAELIQITGGRKWMEAFGTVSDSSEFLGPVLPSDTEELLALRKAARAALESIPRLMGVLDREDHRGLAADSQRTYDQLRAALHPQPQETK